MCEGFSLACGGILIFPRVRRAPYLGGILSRSHALAWERVCEGFSLVLAEEL